MKGYFELDLFFVARCRPEERGARVGWRHIRAARYGEPGAFSLPGTEDIVSIGGIDWRCTKVACSENAYGIKGDILIAAWLEPAQPRAILLPAQGSGSNKIPPLADGDTFAKLLYRLEQAGHHVYIDVARKEGTYQIVDNSER